MMKKGSKGVYLKQTSVEKRSKQQNGADPWCLVCGVNLRVDGRSFLLLTQDSAEETRKLFTKILKVEVREDYASVNLCGKCERALNRISRYDGTDSAKKEAKSLRKSLQKHLKQHGQEAVFSVDDDHEAPTEKEDTGNNVSVDYESPLIDNEVNNKTFSDREADLDQGQEPSPTSEQDKENCNPDKMPIKDLFKNTRKKKEKKDKKKSKGKDKENVADDDASKKTKTEQSEATETKEGWLRPGTLAALAQTMPKKEERVEDWEWDLEPEPEAKPEAKPEPKPEPEAHVPEDNTDTVQRKHVDIDCLQTQDEGKKQDEEKKENEEHTKDEEGMKDEEGKPTETSAELDDKTPVISETATKTENSPLIKESKVKDTAPGMLCCTIL